jgi:hypothetical protein
MYGPFGAKLVRGRLLICCVLALLAFTTLAEQPLGLPDPVVPAPFGVNIHFVVPDEKEVDVLAAGGFQIVRMDFGWEGVERKKGEYDFSGYDKLVESMSKRGIRLLFILDYQHRLYDGGVSPHTDEGRTAFANFAAASAAHYAGKGILWEIWNEPNISFWKPKPNAEDYSKLALATIDAVKKADPKAFILAPASSEFPWEFLEVMGQRGVIAKLDALSVHPYRQRIPETVEADYLKLRMLLDRYSPQRRIPIVSGEWGYSTAWGIKYTEEQQAQFVVRQWLTNMANDIGLSIWYDWKDDGADPKEPEHHFGSVYRDLKPKPAYQAIKTLCETLRGYRFVRRVDFRNSNVYMLAFRKDSEVRLAAWTTGEPTEVTIRAWDDIEAVDMLGVGSNLKAHALQLKNVQVKIPLTQSPQYLMRKTGTGPFGSFWRPLFISRTVHAGANDHWPLEIDNKETHGRFSIQVGGQELGATEVGIGSGQKTVCAIPFRIDQRDRMVVPATIQLGASGGTPMWILVSNSLSATILPWSDTILPVQITSASGEEETLRLRLAGTEAFTKVKIEKGQNTVLALLPLASPVKPGETPRVKVFDEKGEVLTTDPVTWRPIKFDNTTAGTEAGATTWRMQLDGDNKVAATAKVSAAIAVPEGLPGGRDSEVRTGSQQLTEAARGTHGLQIDYRFGNGWRFAQLLPPEGVRAVEGKPVEVGMWVYGDGSENLLRCRFTDSSKQTFQPNGGAIDWKGWRFVTMPLTGEHTGHWGGANDGVIHYPIKWDSLALIDSTHKTVDVDCRIIVAGFALRY